MKYGSLPSAPGGVPKPGWFAGIIPKVGRAFQSIKPAAKHGANLNGPGRDRAARLKTTTDQLTTWVFFFMYILFIFLL